MNQITVYAFNLGRAHRFIENQLLSASFHLQLATIINIIVEPARVLSRVDIRRP